MKICLIYNYAQHYRTSIFKLISETFDTDFYFGDYMADVKKMDYDKLNGQVKEVHTKRICNFTFQPGILRLLAKKDYTTYLMLGDTRSISTWLFLIKSKFYPRKKVFLWSHGYYGKESTIELLLKKLFFRLPNGGVFLYGKYSRSLMIDYGFKPEKLFTLHNSLDYDTQVSIRKKLSPTTVYRDHFNNTDCNLVFIGRLTPVKKLNLILEAMSNCLTEAHLKVNCTFVGSGAEEDNLQRLTNSLNLADRVWFYGACYDESKIGELIYNADICVSPGNVGLTAMHSMVYGTPVITHNDYAHQMPEFEAIIEGRTGCFFQDGDSLDLAKSIMTWLRNNGKRREEVRANCFKEIDSAWTPYFQINVLKDYLC